MLSDLEKLWIAAIYVCGIALALLVYGLVAIAALAALILLFSWLA